MFSFFMIALFILCGVSTRAEEAFYYIVSLNDTLSSIAIKTGPPHSSIYGAGGKLEKILKLNPDIADPNRILPGQRINIAPLASRTVAQEQEVQAVVNVVKTEETASVENLPIQPVQVPVKTEIPTVPVTQAIQAKDMNFGVSAGLVYSKINAVDPRNNSTGVFTSELDPEISLYLVQPIDSGINFGSSISLRQNKFKAPSTGQTLEQPKATFNLQGNVQKEFTSRASAGVYFGLKEKLFSRAVSPLIYTFDVATVPVVGINLKYDFLSHENRKTGAAISYGLLQSSKASSHEVQEGSEGRASLYLESKRNQNSFKQEVFLEKSQQNTNLVNQNETTMGLLLKYEISF